MLSNKQLNKMSYKHLALPHTAKLPINRCNLPAEIIGSLTYQKHPQVILIDGVSQLHRELYVHLDKISDVEARKQKFIDYMNVHFKLQAGEEIGFQKNARIDRRKANYLNVIKGWFFDSNSIEAAVLKSWVESRFGLVTRFHKKLRVISGDEVYDDFLEDRAKGLYNTNALESQLDLLYSYCQYELNKIIPTQRHWTLYRGVNRIDALDTLQSDANQRVVLLNNVNSFSRSRERACEFGDNIIEAEVPVSKIIYYSGLLPLHMAGESEAIVLGGLYRITSSKL
jgi:NAD+--dinitrogen-reductase ADP-D-ribosyltransferase